MLQNYLNYQPPFSSDKMKLQFLITKTYYITYIRRNAVMEGSTFFWTTLLSEELSYNLCETLKRHHVFTAVSTSKSSQLDGIQSWFCRCLLLDGIFKKYWKEVARLSRASIGAPREIFDFPMIFQWKLDKSKKKFPYAKDYGFFFRERAVKLYERH